MSALHVAVAVLFVLDVAVRPFAQLRQNSIYLFLAYAPMLLAPQLGPDALAVMVAGFAAVSHLSFARMVGLTGEPRFYAASLTTTLAFYVVARVGWYGLFQAMPAFAVCAVVAAGAVIADSRAFLQRLCLAWLGLLVYGYLGAHAALFPELTTRPLALTGGQWVSVILFVAKAADWPWALARRFRPGPHWIQLVLSPLGGLAGGGLAGALLGGELQRFAILGALVGAALGFSSRAYGLMVTDVIGEAPGRPLKGTALFGAAFAMAIGYHLVRYWWT